MKFRSVLAVVLVVCLLVSILPVRTAMVSY